MTITREAFEVIMNGENYDYKYRTGKNATLLGLQIVAKYLPNVGIEGADHDIIYSADIDELVNAGITADDAIELRKLGWHLEDIGCLAKFV